MTIHINTFTVAEPEGDGDMSCSLEAEIVNGTAHDVRMVKICTVFYNRDGAAFAASDDNHDVRLEPGEAACLMIGAPWLPSRYCGEEGNDIVCVAKAVLYRREYLKLGEISLPQDHEVSVTLRKAVESDSLDGDILVLLSRTAPDSDGDVMVEARCGVANKSNQRLDTVLLKAEVLDEDDSVVESGESTLSLDPGSFGLHELSTSYVKPGLLKSSRVRLSLAIFHRVDVVCSEGATSEPE